MQLTRNQPGRRAVNHGYSRSPELPDPCSATPHRIRAFSTELIVNRHFFKDVEEADRAAGFHWPADSYEGKDLQDLHIERNLPGAES